RAAAESQRRTFGARASARRNGGAGTMKLSNGMVAGASVAVLIGMLGLGFSADSLYGTFCRVTGYGGTTRIATSAPKEIVDQVITVRFDANVADTPLIF